jgi:hypothetical protein
MRKILLAAASLIVLSCNDDAKEKKTGEIVPVLETVTLNSLSEDEKKEGWQLLFDGVSTKGWHKYGDTVTGSAWKVVDSTLHLDATDQENWQIKGGGDIVTNDEFENFHLKLEWKIDTCGNSGVVFKIHEDPKKYKWGWETGPEMQILDNTCHPDAKIIKHRAGDLYDLVSSSKETVKPALEWNQMEIKVLKNKLDFWLNGENVVSILMGDDNWKAMLKNSKWKDHPDFSTYASGKIGLQDHGNNVWFRNIKIKKL